MASESLSSGLKRINTRSSIDGPARREYDNASLLNDVKNKVDAITSPITVADATERKALTGVVGVTRVIQADLIGILWTLVAADETLDASWIGQPYTVDPDGDVVVNMQLADVAGTVPDANVMGQVANVPTIGDGVATGGHKVAMRYDLPTASQAGYATMVSVKTSNINLTARHDGTDSATGICYSVDGGTPVYQAKAADTNTSLTIPHNDGAPVHIAVWSATSATSGSKGNLTYLNCNNNSLTSLDVSGLTALTTLQCYNNSLTSLDVSNLTALTTLSCSSNSLTSLDFSNNTALLSLACDNNSLTSLDVSGLTALTYLNCNNNSLTSLDVSGLTALTELDCGNNSLTSLRAVGAALSYNHYSYNGTSVNDNNLDAAALDQFYTDLAAATGFIDVSGNPGTTGDDPTIATAKGYVISGT